MVVLAEGLVREHWVGGIDQSISVVVWSRNAQGANKSGVSVAVFFYVSIVGGDEHDSIGLVHPNKATLGIIWKQKRRFWLIGVGCGKWYKLSQQRSS